MSSYGLPDRLERATYKSTSHVVPSQLFVVQRVICDDKDDLLCL